jgi:hypothetical protein
MNARLHSLDFVFGVTPPVHSAVRPTANRDGVVDALFDGTNGYVYAVINDRLNNGTMNVVRISR